MGILPHSDGRDLRDLGAINKLAREEVRLLINMNMTAIMSLMTVPSLPV